MTVRKRISTILLAALLAIGCSSFKPWSRVGEFRNQLSCGLSLEEVLKIAARFDGPVITGPLRHDGTNTTTEQPREMFALNHKGTTLELGFAHARLETVRLSWISGWTQVKTEMRENICTGERSAEVCVDGPSFLGNHEVFIDGHPAGRLSSVGNAFFWLPPGEHIVHVILPSGQTVSQVFSIADRSDGFARILLNGDD